MVDFQQLEIASTILFIIVIFYLIAVIGLRSKFHMKNGTLAKPSSRNEGVHEENSKMINNKSKDGQEYPYLFSYVIIFAVLPFMFIRSLIYLALILTNGDASQLACDLLMELLHLFGGIELVFVYTFTWRTLRYYYFTKIYHHLYTTWVRYCSWIVALMMIFISAGRLTILMAGWRFGEQYKSDFSYSCVTDTYNSTIRNVTAFEWELPYLYNSVCGTTLCLFMLVLYGNLFFRSCQATATDSRFKSIGLTKVTLLMTLCLASPVTSQVLYLRLLKHETPAVLFNQLDDVITIVQVFAMTFSLADWKKTFTPWTYRQKNVKKEPSTTIELN